MVDLKKGSGLEFTNMKGMTKIMNFYDSKDRGEK